MFILLHIFKTHLLQKKKKKSDVSNSDRTLSGFRREVGREMVTVIREIREQQVWVATTFVLPG